MRRYECGLCMVSPSSDRYIADRETVVGHITEDHGSDDVDLWLCDATEQETLC